MKYIAHNVKGALMPVNVVEEYDLFLQQENFENVYLRIQGGTLSQRTGKNGWSNEMITAWVTLQDNNPEVKFLFGVNLNESVSDATSLYSAFKSKGAIFAGICMGNEWYLDKFIKGDLSKPEVTVRTANMTPEKYLAIAAEYRHIFDEPLIYQLAPLKNQNRDAQRRNANNVIIEAIQNTNAFFNIHIYPNPKTGFDYSYLSEVKEQTGKSIYITEFGYGDPTIDVIDLTDLVLDDLLDGVSNVIDQAQEHLDSNDIMFSQVLWNSNPSNPVIDWINGELTNKGKLLVEKFHKEDEVIEPPVEPPVENQVKLINVYPKRIKGSINYSFRIAYTYLRFNDETIIKIKTRFGTKFPFGIEDVDKTKQQLFNEYFK